MTLTSRYFAMKSSSTWAGDFSESRAALTPAVCSIILLLSVRPLLPENEATLTDPAEAGTPTEPAEKLMLVTFKTLLAIRVILPPAIPASPASMVPWGV